MFYQLIKSKHHTIENKIHGFFWIMKNAFRDVTKNIGMLKGRHISEENP